MRIEPLRLDDAVKLTKYTTTTYVFWQIGSIYLIIIDDEYDTDWIAFDDYETALSDWNNLTNEGIKVK